MTVFNLGSINLDIIYRLPHLPKPGETLASIGRVEGLGGKGANQSVALAKAGAEVNHIGALGKDGGGLKGQLAEYGVDTVFIVEVEDVTGHAVIYVDDQAENSIVLHKGANHALTPDMLENALARASQGDWLLAQNETNMVEEAAILAKSKGMKVAYAAAPFSAEAVASVLDHVDLIAVNEIEAEQLATALPDRAEQLETIQMLVTLGARGAELRHRGETVSVPSYKVEPVDTTGAGDTFLGYFLAAIARGSEQEQALQLASGAAAIQVTRPGAAPAIPDLAEVEQFIKER